jgi:hypothetical protein
LGGFCELAAINILSHFCSPLQHHPFQLQPLSPKPQAPAPEKKEIPLEEMDISQLLEFIKTQRDLMGQVDAKEAEVRKNLSRLKTEIQTYLEFF